MKDYREYATMIYKIQWKLVRFFFITVAKAKFDENQNG